jgi:hypothetical protein
LVIWILYKQNIGERMTDLVKAQIIMLISMFHVAPATTRMKEKMKFQSIILNPASVGAGFYEDGRKDEVSVHNS